MKRSERKRIPPDWFQVMTGCRAQIDAPGCRALVLFAIHEERLRPIDVTVQAHYWLDVATWRSFPLALIESRANEPEAKRLLLKYADRVKLAPIPETPPEETWSQLAPFPEKPLQLRSRLPDLTVSRPPHPPFPDAVYQTVARHYQTCVRWSAPPAQSIADANKVPVRTVHGWVREARRRGFLEPARRGRVS